MQARIDKADPSLLIRRKVKGKRVIKFKIKKMKEKRNC
jgi:hypothetical protein